MKKSAFLFVAFGVGVCGAVFCFWLSRHRGIDLPTRDIPRLATAIPPAEADAGSLPPAVVGVSPQARSLWETFQRLLARRDRRAREALLTFKDDAALRRFLERAPKSGLEVLGQLEGLRTVRARYGEVGALQKELIQHAADYDGLATNQLVGIPQVPPKENRAVSDQVPFGNDTLAFLGASGDRSQWGRGTTIAILDSGVASDATFGNGRLRALDIGLGLSPGKGEEDGHGTAVAALAAGFSPDAAGVAPAAGILSIRVTDANGLSDMFTVSQAIIAAVDAGAKIVNISLGGYATSATLSAAIGYAIDRGAVIVAAAGNDQAAQLAWPAADPRVVSVGAVDKAEQQVSFSNSGAQLKLSAPGYGVQTAWLDGERAYVDGTSASAPLVAGALAAVLSQNPALTPQQALQLLQRTASDAGAPGADAAFGSGILNLGWTMNSGNAAYVDTAISSHFFDAPNHEMQFVIQNRSGQAIGGMMLNVGVGATTPPIPQPLPVLSAGESYVVKIPVEANALKAAGSLRFTTQLANPAGVTDKVPANNRRASVLSAPANPTD